MKGLKKNFVCRSASDDRARSCTATWIAAADAFYEQRNLVSDGSIAAAHTDPNLVNAWGVAFNPTGAVWVANNHPGTSTLYDGDGNIIPLVVQIPGPYHYAPGAPTGIVFNASTNFKVTKGNASEASPFIFATEQGTIAAWSPKIDLTHATMVVDNS